MAILSPKYTGVRKSKKTKPTDYQSSAALMIDGLSMDVVDRFYSVPNHGFAYGVSSPQEILVYLLELAELVERNGLPRE